MERDKASPKFVEILGRMESRRETAFMGLLAVSVTAIILAVTLWVTMTAPKPVIVVPGATRAGMYRPGQIPASALKDFARDYALSLVHYNPTVLEEKLTRARRRSSPSLQARIEAKEPEIISHVRNYSVSQSFTPSKVVVRETDGGGHWRAFVRGELIQYVGSKEIKRGPYRVVLQLERTEPTEENPCGVWVTSVTQNFIIKNKGKQQ